MTKFLKISIILVLLFLVVQLLESNAKILWKINQVNFDNFFDVALSLLKAFGYSLATIVIVISYKNYLIRALFIIIDMAVVYIYYHFTDTGWWLYASYAYPIYTGLIFAFIGHMAFNRWKIAEDTSGNQQKLRVYEIKEQVLNLKRAGRNGKKWDHVPEVIQEIEELKNELETIQN